MHVILTYQSIKENPSSARDTNVSINKREYSKNARDTNVSINKRES